jgi:copper chaperone CopZ
VCTSIDAVTYPRPTRRTRGPSAQFRPTDCREDSLTRGPSARRRGNRCCGSRAKSTRGGIIERRSVPAPGLRSDDADQLERSLAALPGVLTAHADADRAEVIVEVDPEVVSDEEIAAAMGNAGLDASA